MRPFAYVRAPGVAEAVQAFGSQPGARYLGGGTNLVDLMKLGVERPGLLVDVSRLPLGGIEVGADGGLTLGAALSNSDVAADLEVRRRYPALAQAVLAGASGQLRNLATVGGNLLQRTRCSYFNDVSKPCNKRVPGSGCPAVSGEHHNMAILGASDRCIATHPSDLAVALVAFDAMVQVHEPTGAREVPITALYRPVGDTPHLELTTAPGALITGVRLPGLAMAAGSRYRKVRERASYAFAIGSIAAALDVADGRVAGVRIALGAVASMPWRARRAEDFLIGRPVDAASFALAADAELAAARPLPGNAYKVALVRNLIVRMLSDLAGDRP